MFNTDVDINRSEISDILKSALKNEKAASDNYKVIAGIFKTAHDVVMEKIFLEMSSVEKGHFKRLAKALKCHENDTVFLDEPAAWKSPETHNSTYWKGLTIDEIVNALKEAEKESEAFYRSAAKKTGRRDLKALFRDLAAEEAKHQRLIKKIVKHALNRPSTS